MRKEPNRVILEKSDCLYRYFLGVDLPSSWLSEIHSPEYYSDRYGHKNAIGAFFFYDKEKTALQVLSQAIFNQRKKGNIYKHATITKCEVKDEIVLFDLESGLFNCSNIVSTLMENGLNVITDSFFNYQKEKAFSWINNEIENLYSSNSSIRFMAAKNINEFFFNYPPLLCQSLTDFNNGLEFKRILEEQDYEGYVFMEEFSSNTYCLLNADKISSPDHKIIDIENDEIIQGLIRKIEQNATR